MRTASGAASGGPWSPLARPTDATSIPPPLPAPGADGAPPDPALPHKAPKRENLKNSLLTKILVLSRKFTFGKTTAGCLYPAQSVCRASGTPPGGPQRPQRDAGRTSVCAASLHNGLSRAGAAGAAWIHWASTRVESQPNLEFEPKSAFQISFR